ncbi:unnamed protein product [Arabis nemorensis]|uniref:C2H2-type domain-containing protein n=1 Tax=Arabis nemorensis TaxID=586526 RepID=A0A565CLW4_9BRAS|nr:unnamed protein product [Arabis nemorensis]
MEEEQHQDLEKPINGILRNLTNTQSREESSMNHQKREISCHYALRENPKKKTQKSFGLESPESMKKILFRCVECGKGFRYEKCLSNHQKVMHLSTKLKKKVHEEEEPMKSLCSNFSLVTKKKRSRIIRYKKKTPLSCSFTTFLETRSVSAENDEELEVAECLILLSKSCPKFVDGLKLVAEAIETPKGSYDSGCLRSKKLRKAGEFESGFFSCEQKLMEERVRCYETSKEPAIFFRDNNKTGEFGYGFLSNEHNLLEEGISSDETWREPASFLGHKSGLDQQKLRKGGEFGTGLSSNFESDSELGVGAMKCSDFNTEIVTEANEENLEHQCKLCNKIFSSYQALGGHQTFHRMSKNKNKKHCC